MQHNKYIQKITTGIKNMRRGHIMRNIITKIKCYSTKFWIQISFKQPK